MSWSRIPALFIAAATLAIAGCVVHVGDDDGRWDDDWKERQEYNRSSISRLEIGMSRAEVESRLGQPDFTEAYSHDGKQYRILHYRTQHRHSDGETSKDETTPLVFLDDRLEGWGETLYGKVTSGADK